MRHERTKHLAAVRRMFEDADWLIFTLGLTEAWRSTIDGAVYPIAPGVAAGSYEPGRYEFVNFGAHAVQRDLAKFIDLVGQRNPTCRFILTVSPVPLVATYENRHVLTSTTCSKAILRVACDEVERMYKNVTYFPSYEIITAQANGGAYYADDLREVTELGVSHVMRVFRKHCVGAGSAAAPDAPVNAATMPQSHKRSEPGADQDVICDEEIIETALSKTSNPF